MPNRTRRNSVVDELAKVPVNRGSLIKSIEDLLKTIEASESSVMIPTLLRDKCQFDAWELLFVAKILKASILGHSDLVEFYMNHMGNQAIKFQQQQQQLAGQPQAPSSPSGRASTVGCQFAQQQQQQQQQQQPVVAEAPASEPTSWFSAGASSSSGADSLNGRQQVESPIIMSAGKLFAVVGDTSAGQETASSLLAITAELSRSNGQLVATPINKLKNSNSVSATSFTNNNIEQMTSQLEQQVTLINNNNSVSPPGPIASCSPVATGACNSLEAQAAPLSVSTTTTTATTTTTTTPTPTQAPAPGQLGYSLNLQGADSVASGLLRTSRSSGCLSRLNNSGPSSPRTPLGTPCASESLWGGSSVASGQLQQNGSSSGEPSAPVKLLLQIEELKSSIGRVKSQLESVVDLYKKSIDNMAIT